MASGSGVKLPPIGGSGVEGRALWNRTKHAAASIHFLQKSGKETWRNIISSDLDGWQLPIHLYFCTAHDAQCSASQWIQCNDCETWVKRRVMLANCRLLAVSGKDRTQKRVLTDLRDAREVGCESTCIVSMSVCTPNT